jgi:hypothetical protein
MTNSSPDNMPAPSSEPEPRLASQVSLLGAALAGLRTPTFDPIGSEAGPSHIGHDLRTAGVAADFHPIAVARAAQSLLNRFARGINCIGRLAANPFGGAIRHGDGAGPRPVPGQAEERSFGTGFRLGLRRNKQNCRRDHRFFEAASRGFRSKVCHDFAFQFPCPRSQSCRGPAIMATLPRVAPCRRALAHV